MLLTPASVFAAIGPFSDELIFGDAELECLALHLGVFSDDMD